MTRGTYSIDQRVSGVFRFFFQPSLAGLAFFSPIVPSDKSLGYSQVVRFPDDNELTFFQTDESLGYSQVVRFPDDNELTFFQTDESVPSDKSLGYWQVVRFADANELKRFSN